MIVWMDIEETEYLSCPIKFIAQNVLDWYAEYKYYKEFSGIPAPYDQMPNKWLEALSEYQHYVMAYQEEITISKTPDKTTPLKNALKERLQNGKK